ncbi:MFS transporter [Pseudomonas saliphila]|uniref:MFS transporter n=1 Tax=Pseudomonas saliphila TaxID=2586906 RepID=UPI001238DBFE|nr:MFS transporter [Pseudomonas saliphila]
MGTTTLLSFFTLPVSTALDVPRAAFTLYTSIMSLMVIVSMPFWGKMLPKIGIRAMVAISGAGAGLSYIAMSYFTSLWQFYVAGIVVGFTLPACSFLPASVIITNWFEHRRGMAMGIAMAFTGVYAAIASTFLPSMIMKTGWESAYLFLGIVVLALTIPIAPFLHIHPSKVGLSPYGAKVAPASEPLDTQPGISARRAYRSGAFWLICTALFFGHASIIGFIQHAPAHLTSKGVSPVEAGTFMSLCMLSLIGAKVMLGWLNDRIGTINANFICLFLGSLALLLFTRMDGQPVISVIGITLFVAYAFGYAYNSIFPPLLISRMFGATKDFASIYGVAYALACVGVAAGPPLFGTSYDLTGSYDTMLIISLGFVAISAVLTILALRLSDRIPKTL